MIGPTGNHASGAPLVVSDSRPVSADSQVFAAHQPPPCLVSKPKYRKRLPHIATRLMVLPPDDAIRFSNIHNRIDKACTRAPLGGKIPDTCKPNKAEQQRATPRNEHTPHPSLPIKRRAWSCHKRAHTNEVDHDAAGRRRKVLGPLRTTTNACTPSLRWTCLATRCGAQDARESPLTTTLR